MSGSPGFASALRGAAAAPSLAAAARGLALDGIPVFPCEAGGKRPITGHGFHDATTDARQVAAWWGRTPRANVGVPTGAVSGMVVADIDVRGAVDGRVEFGRAERVGLVGGWTLLVRTPAGGMHAYYSATPGVEQRSWQAAAAGVDFRGDGGYIIVPPSRRTIDGVTKRYEVVAARARHDGLDAARLREFLDPRPEPAPVRAGGRLRDADVARLAAWVAGRGEGERNRSLFWAACRFAENGRPTSEALDVLTAAASQAGLSEREIASTVRSAYRLVPPGPHAPATWGERPVGSLAACPRGRGL